jgi:hypothetical protein
MERYTLEDHETYRKEQDEKAAKEAEERTERMEKEPASRAWLAEGGSEADFEKEWPKLRDEGRRAARDRRRPPGPRGDAQRPNEQDLRASMAQMGSNLTSRRSEVRF